MSTAAVTQGIFDYLRSASGLTALIATYKSNPAIFTTDVAPEDPPLPYVHCSGINRYPEPVDLDGKLREFSFTVEAYADKSGDPIPADTIGDQIAALFAPAAAKAGMTIAGFTIIHTVVDGPIPIDTDPDTYGRSVGVRCMIYPA